MNYPMRRIEPILNMMAQGKWNFFFKADAANGYWAVPLAIEHAYKIAEEWEAIIEDARRETRDETETDWESSSSLSEN